MLPEFVVFQHPTRVINTRLPGSVGDIELHREASPSQIYECILVPLPPYSTFSTARPFEE